MPEFPEKSLKVGFKILPLNFSPKPRVCPPPLTTTMFITPSLVPTTLICFTMWTSAILPLLPMGLLPIPPLLIRRLAVPPVRSRRFLAIPCLLLMPPLPILSSLMPLPPTSLPLPLMLFLQFFHQSLAVRRLSARLPPQVPPRFHTPEQIC